jgi:hypothetical protein
VELILLKRICYKNFPFYDFDCIRSNFIKYSLLILFVKSCLNISSFYMIYQIFILLMYVEKYLAQVIIEPGELIIIV